VRENIHFLRGVVRRADVSADPMDNI